MEFKATLDKFSKIISAIFLMFALVMLGAALSGRMVPDANGNLLLSIVAALLLLLGVMLFLYSPRAYLVEGKDLLVRRLIGNKRIVAADISRIRMPDEKELKWPIRTFGNGGLFGYTGRYYTKHIGSMIWYCSRRDRLIVVERNFKLPVIISPDNPAAFLQAYYKA